MPFITATTTALRRLAAIVAESSTAVVHTLQYGDSTRTFGGRGDHFNAAFCLGIAPVLNGLAGTGLTAPFATGTPQLSRQAMASICFGSSTGTYTVHVAATSATHFVPFGQSHNLYVSDGTRAAVLYCVPRFTDRDQFVDLNVPAYLRDMTRYLDLSQGATFRVLLGGGASGETNYQTYWFQNNASPTIRDANVPFASGATSGIQEFTDAYTSSLDDQTHIRAHLTGLTAGKEVSVYGAQFLSRAKTTGCTFTSWSLGGAKMSDLDTCLDGHAAVLTAHGPKIVFVSLGVNDAIAMDSSAYDTAARSACAKIHAALPDAVIVLQQNCYISFTGESDEATKRSTQAALPAMAAAIAEDLDYVIATDEYGYCSQFGVNNTNDALLLAEFFDAGDAIHYDNDVATLIGRASAQLFAESAARADAIANAVVHLSGVTISGNNVYISGRKVVAGT